jgi:Domain of unknown function (DUF3303)
MKFICRYSWVPDGQTQDESIRRFKETGGQPPAGAKLLGRWTQADFMGGFALLESDDPKALAQFSLMWSDLMELEIVPVLDDPEILDVLQKAGK